jgi:predicted hydrocarbon binding protein
MFNLILKEYGFVLKGKYKPAKNLGDTVEGGTGVVSKRNKFPGLFFDVKNAQVQVNDGDVIIMQGNTLRALLEGMERAFGPSASFILLEAGKYAGKDFVERLLRAGANVEEIPYWFAKVFTDWGWGKIHYSVEKEKKEAIIAIENCVTTRNVVSDKPVCHFIRGYIEGVYEVLWSDVTECCELLCAAKGDPFCEFRVLRIFPDNTQQTSGG